MVAAVSIDPPNTPMEPSRAASITVPPLCASPSGTAPTVGLGRARARVVELQTAAREGEGFRMEFC
jgi:hypothetical protein